ncbi:MAG TPA: aldose 1-epimerase family protein [Planctomycetaceae bacterium]|nr:aldose 1-epimerase family protein [Planctomycetaceae bacterium]
MSGQEFVITCFDTGIHHESFHVGPTEVGPLAGADHWHIRARTLQGGESHGVQVVTLYNGVMELSILPTRGMGVWRGHYRNLPLGWESPVKRPVHPAFVNLHDRNGLGWLNGFNELMCRCGLGFNGPPGNDEGTAVTLHGRIANLPAHRVVARVDSHAGVIEVQGVVDEVSMFGPALRLTSTVRMHAGSSRCDFIDEVTNLGGTDTPLSLLYHINIGQPYLEAGSENLVACKELAPRDPHSAKGVERHAEYGPPTVGLPEEAFYYRPLADAQNWSTAVLKNKAATAAFAVHYRADQLPCFTVWKNTQSLAEGYVTGLEPGVNLPNFRAYERQQNRLPKLAPGATYRSEFSWEFADDAAGVTKLVDRVKTLQQAVKPVMHPTPQAGWSPSGEK